VIIASSSQEKVDGAVKRLSDLGTDQSVEGRICDIAAGEAAIKEFFGGLPEFNHLSTILAYYGHDCSLNLAISLDSGYFPCHRLPKHGFFSSRE
jgi:hypothetical protein